MALVEEGDPQTHGYAATNWTAPLLRTELGKRSWVVERSFAWVARFRLARDYEGPPTVLAGLHFIAFACLFLRRVTAACLSRLARRDTGVKTS